MAVIVCSNTSIVPSSRLNLRNFKVPQTDIARTQQSDLRRLIYPSAQLQRPGENWHPHDSVFDSARKSSIPWGAEGRRAPECRGCAPLGAPWPLGSLSRPPHQLHTRPPAITHRRADGAAANDEPDESARPKRRRCVLGAVGRFQKAGNISAHEGGRQIRAAKQGKPDSRRKATNPTNDLAPR
jgi:hypothetical protein